MNIHINIIKGEIVLTFGQHVSWVSFTPATAREFAESLNKLATEAESGDASRPAGMSIQ